MIGKSDLFILLVSASLLAVGVYRWQHNLALINSNSQQAQTRMVAPANNANAVSSISSNSAQATATISTVSNVQTSASATVLNQATETSIVAANISDSSTVLQPAIEPIEQPSSILLGSYRVVSGDYLSKIAQQFGTTVETLQEINNINGSLIEIGQEIQFPLPSN